jgi:hypothetical protein
MTTEKTNADESVQSEKSQKAFSKLMLLAWEVRMFNMLLDQISKKHEIKIFGKTLFSFRTAKYNPATDTFQPLCAVLFDDMKLTTHAIDDIMRKRWVQWALNIECDKTRGYLQLWCEQLPQAIFTKYVHQLQNLFYCLFSEELTINP